MHVHMCACICMRSWPVFSTYHSQACWSTKKQALSCPRRVHETDLRFSRYMTRYLPLVLSSTILVPGGFHFCKKS